MNDYTTPRDIRNETKPNEQKFVFFIACTEISFADSEGATGVTRVNSMIKSENGTVGVKLLGRAQQAAQMQLIEKLNDPNLNILNVVFVSINMLGQMTDTEFHNND